MTLSGLIILLIVAGIAGALGQSIAGYSTGGCFTSIAVGFVGALIGMWLARALQLPELFVVNVDGKSFPIIWSIIGAALFVAAISMISHSKRRSN